MKSIAKSAAMMRDLSDRLKTRTAGSATINTVRAANDANGWPMLFLSSGGVEAAGSPVIALRISSVDGVSKDVFGNQLTAFNPHILEVSYELTAGGKPVPSDRDLVIAEWESFKLGMRTQIKENANGTAVSETSMNAATPLVELDDLYFPNKGV